jgi:hypothetical protein
MADINAYALSLEFTLQSNAEEVLGNISTKIDDIESKMKNMLSGLGKVMSDSSTKIEKDIDSVAKSISNVGTKGAMTSKEIAAAIAAIKNAKKTTEQTADSTTASVDAVKEYKKRWEELTLAMDKLELDIFSEKDREDVSGRVETIKKQYEELIELRKKEGINIEDMAQMELESIDKINQMDKDIRSERNMAQKTLIRTQRAWDKETSGRYKREILSKKELIKLGIKDMLTGESKLNTYEEYMEAVKDQASLEKGGKGGKTLEQAKGSLKTMAVIQGLKQAMGMLIAGFKKLISIMKNFMDTIGLGKLTQLVSVTGLLKEAIMGTAQEEEEWHTINYRTIGSMRDLQASVTDAAISNEVFREELIKSRKALREVGAGATEIFELDQAVGVLQRTTAASYENLARFAKTMTVVSGDTQKANKDLMLFQRGAKALGLTGKDLDWVLQQATESAFIMGSRGELFADKYNMALLKTAGAAKKLGMDTSSAGDIINKLRDPLGYIEILGREAFNMDPEEKLEAVAAKAEEMFEKLSTSSDAAREKLRISYIMGWQAADVEKNLKLLIEAGEDGGEAYAKALMSPQQQMAKSMEEAAGYMRNISKVINDIISRIKQDFQPLIDMFSNLAKTIAKSPILLWTIKWGIYLGIAGKAIGSIIGFLPQFLTFAQTWQTISTLSGGVGTNMSKLGGTLSSTIMQTGKLATAMKFVGGAAAVVGAAIAGWTIGTIIDDTLGLSEATYNVEKELNGVIRGTKTLSEAWDNMSWWDVTKYVATNAALTAVTGGGWAAWKAYQALDIKLDDIRDKAQRELQKIQAEKIKEKYGAVEMTGLDVQIKALGQQINDLRNKQKKSKEEEQALTRATKEHADAITLRNALEQFGDKTAIQNAQERLKLGTKEQKAIDKAKNAYDQARASQKETQKLMDAMKSKNRDGQFDTAIERANKKLSEQKEKVKELKDAFKALIEDRKQKDGDKEEKKFGQALKISKEKAAEYLAQLGKLKKGTTEHRRLREKIAETVGGHSITIEGQLQEALKKTEKKAKQKEQKGKVDEKEMSKTADLEIKKLNKVPALDKVIKESVKAGAAVAVEAKKEEPEVEPITTAKIEAEAIEKEDENLIMASRQNNNLEAMSRKLDGLNAGAIEGIVRLLNDYLPKIADKDTGLATTANQWFS